MYAFGIVKNIADAAQNASADKQVLYKRAIVAVLEQDIKSMRELGWALMSEDVGAMIVEYMEECL